ncbi:MAG: ABC transporter permease [Phycisphaerae bacterium]|nr:ABC transporter permease [Phycisphaerae bacterium]
MIANLWRQRELTWQFVKREVVARHRGTYLGLAWSVVLPLFMLAVYTFIFSVVFKAKWNLSADESPARFAVTMFCGTILFDVFAATVGNAPSVIVNNPNYVKKVVFPLEVLPLALLGSSLVYGAISLVVLLAGVVLLQGYVPATAWLFPLVVLPLLMFSAGLAWFFAGLGVFLRDIRQLISGVLMPVLFFMTPIFYPIDRVPERFRIVLQLNPLSPIVDSARRVLMWGQAPDWLGLAATAVIGGVVMLLGYAFFMKGKRGFADVL